MFWLRNKKNIFCYALFTKGLFHIYQCFTIDFENLSSKLSGNVGVYQGAIRAYNLSLPYLLKQGIFKS